MALALISLGSNLGDRAANLQAAIDACRLAPEIQLRAVSCWHESAPVGGPSGQGAFLNGAALIETALSPSMFLALLQEIETHAGRNRGVRWDARTLDLDLLLYDQIALDTPRLTLPHPRMGYRRFVLAPAVEIAPELQHPLFGCSVRQLWDHSNSTLPYLAIASSHRDSATQLAMRVAERLPARLLLDCSSSAEDALDCWRTLLASDTWPQAPIVTVSDFWFGQGEAEAPTPDLRDQWRAASQGVARPRLVIRLDDKPAACVGRGLPSEMAPWLALHSTDLAGAVDEAVAAVQAMQ